MTLQINFARPNLIQEGSYNFKLSSWVVKGKIVAEDGECHCNDKLFDVNIDTDKLSLTKEEMESLVWNKLNEK
jgi:hypothetical protein